AVKDPPFDMVKGIDYVYEEDINRAYRAITFAFGFLSMVSGYNLARSLTRSSAVETKNLQKKLFWLVAKISGIHGEKFMVEQIKDIKTTRPGHRTDMVLRSEWVARRAIADEAYNVLISMLYYTKINEEEEIQTHSRRDALISEIKDLKIRKHEAINTGNETIRDLKQVQSKLVEEVILVTEFADKLRSTTESGHSLIFTDYRTRLVLQGKTFPRVSTRAGEILGILTDVLDILMNPRDYTMESTIVLKYMIQVGSSSRRESRRGRRVNIMAGSIKGPIATTPGRIRTLMNGALKLDKKTQTSIDPFVEEMDKRLPEFMFAGKRIQDEARHIEELDQEAITSTIRFKNLKKQISLIKGAQRETQLIANRAQNALIFLETLGKMGKGEEEKVVLHTPEMAFKAIIQQAGELNNLSKISLDSKKDLWDNYTDLIQNIDDLSRTYLHILMHDDFTSEFLNLKKAERDLKALEQFDVNRPWKEIRPAFIEHWDGIIDTTIRDASNLQGILTLAQRKNVKNVFMFVGSAHIKPTKELIKANHGGAWTITALPLTILRKTREEYYAIIEQGIRNFASGEGYKGAFTPIKRDPKTPIKRDPKTPFKPIGDDVDDTVTDMVFWDGEEGRKTKLYF
ncbi:MAG: hypothetical protein ACTSUE_10310, partial [Promethearchaeota archaeon]